MGRVRLIKFVIHGIYARIFFLQLPMACTSFEATWMTLLFYFFVGSF